MSDRLTKMEVNIASRRKLTAGLQQIPVDEQY
jgi:hypothetical protein